MTNRKAKNHAEKIENAKIALEDARIAVANAERAILQARIAKDKALGILNREIIALKMLENEAEDF